MCYGGTGYEVVVLKFLIPCSRVLLEKSKFLGLYINDKLERPY
jgi:hypothetical protein